MSRDRQPGDEPSPDHVLDLARSRERLDAQRKDRAAAELAARFHAAMGWKGKPPRGGRKKKSTKKK